MLVGRGERGRKTADSNKSATRTQRHAKSYLCVSRIAHMFACRRAGGWHVLMYCCACTTLHLPRARRKNSVKVGLGYSRLSPPTTNFSNRTTVSSEEVRLGASKYMYDDSIVCLHVGPPSHVIACTGARGEHVLMNCCARTILHLPQPRRKNSAKVGLG